MTKKTTIIDLNRRPDGSIAGMNERVIRHNAAPAIDHDPFEALQFVEANGTKYRTGLKESFLKTPDAANILRTGIRYLAFSRFAEMPRSFDGFTDFVDSNKPQEEYLRDAAIGIIPRAPSGSEAPNLISNFEGGTTVKNYLYRGIVPVLGDWIRFDQLGKVRQVGMELGRAGRMTEEWEVYKYITTTGNYTRNSTTNDNDIGANQQTLTFNSVSLETACSVIATARDRKSGSYLGYMPNTLIAGPRMMVPVLQLLNSTQLQRASAGDSSAEVRGTGTTNPWFNGMIDQVIFSPWFSTNYDWALCDRNAGGFVFQTVEPFNVMEEAQGMTSEAYLTMDQIRYLVMGYFGLGFVDDRAWFFSDANSTAPTVS